MKAFLTPATFLLLFFCFSANAQMGPKQTIFNSDVNYPFYLTTGDVDLDGDIDFVFQDIYIGLKLFRNQGNGIFNGYELIGSTNIFSGGSDFGQIADVDGDGDGDIINRTTWYRNNGPGLSFTLVGNLAPAGIITNSYYKDIDGDGDPDFIGCSTTHVMTIINDGTGNYSIADTLGSSGNCSSIYSSFADVNGDMVEDLIIGGNNTQAGLYLGLGGGNFGSQQLIAQYQSPSVPFLGDMDKDGDADLFAAGTLPYKWFSNDGNGNFTYRDTIVGSVTLPQMVADVDGDQDIDFSWPSTTQCRVWIKKNVLPAPHFLETIEDFNAYQLQGVAFSNADFDNDGDQDLVIATGLGVAGWYPNLGNGNIGERITIGRVMAQGQDADMADTDQDGDQDIVVPNFHSDMVTLYRSNNDGTYAQQEIIAEHCDRVSRVRCADLNSDSRPDLITNVQTHTVIWNTGSGWNAGTLPSSLIAKQVMYINADQYPDLLCDSAWLQNDGNGNFTVMQDPDIPVIYAADTADMNGDGITDCVVFSSFNNSMVLIKDATGDFTSLPITGLSPVFDLGDMDGDGAVDIAGDVVLLNDGSGNFTSVTYQKGTGNMNAALLFDVDGDGNTDLLNSRSGTYDHYMYVNRGIGGGFLSGPELIDNNAGYVRKIFMSDVNNDAVADMINVCWQNMIWRENNFTDAYRLRGSVFKDLDMDAVSDAGEPKVPFQLVRSDANNYLVWTNSTGDYDLAADTGTHKVWTTPPAIYQITNNPDTLLATLSDVNPIQSGLDFGLSPVGLDSSALLTLTTSGTLTRCNTNLDVFVNVKNTGIFVPAGTLIKVLFHPDLSINSFAAAPDSVSGNEYFWKIDSLGWFQQWNNMIAITTGPVGSTSYVEASFIWSAGSPPIVETLGGPVTCAFDPNDKLVTPQGYGIYGAVSTNTDEFIYTVRFQNTGNDTAFTVIIRDVLDGDLDWSSLDILATSHPLTGIQVDNGGLATFRFDQILLPDSNVNEPASHGFIKYRINTKNQFDGMEVSNTALIYFDLNQPVVTNTVINTLKNCQNFNATIIQRQDTLLATTGETYQWFRYGNLMPGANNQWFVPVLSGDYTVVVTNVYGCTDTSGIFNVVCPFYASVITSGTLLCPGSTITLSTQVYDSYQWYRNGVLLPGETGSTLNVSSIPGSSAYYSVMATLNNCSELSSVVYLGNLNYPALPILCSGSFYPDPQMQNFMLCDSNSTDSIIFSISSFFTANITWYKDGIPIPGADSNMLVVKSPGSYTVSAGTSNCPLHSVNSPDTFQVAVNSNHPVISWNGLQLEANPATLNNWQWYLDGVAIPLSNSSVYTPQQTGNYTVSGNDPFCSFLSDAFYFDPVGLAEQQANSLLLYPNPAHDKFHIASGSVISRVEISDLSGRQVLVHEAGSKYAEINLAGISTGIYNIRITSGESATVRRLIIQ